MVGLRGAGKTVLLNRLLVDGGGRGFECVLIEAPEDRSLPGTLAGPLNSALIRMSRGAAAKEPARRARRALAGFVGAMKLTFDDIAFSIDLEKEEGVADSGDMDTDLTMLMQVAGEAARARATALVLSSRRLSPCVSWTRRSSGSGWSARRRSSAATSGPWPNWGPVLIDREPSRRRWAGRAREWLLLERDWSRRAFT